MLYKLNWIKIRMNNYKKGIKSINYIWKDIVSGKLFIFYVSWKKDFYYILFLKKGIDIIWNLNGKSKKKIYIY